MRLLILCLTFTLLPALPEALVINIFCYNNGWGLQKDAEILAAAMEALGHTPRQLSPYSPQSQCPAADINIFIEYLNQALFKCAKKNYFIPNPEWDPGDKKGVKKCDRILCRTKDAQKIYRKINKKTYYLGFTSHDCFLPATPKDYYAPIHCRGASIFKGTEELLEAWQRHPEFPSLLLLHNGSGTFAPLPNLQIIDTYLPAADFRQLQNLHGLHLCPSKAEGFGHYIVEAMSTQAVVITTDAPPMNEHITDPRCLVRYTRTAPHREGTLYYVAPQDLAAKVSHLMILNKEELAAIGQKNRERYLQMTEEFQRRLQLLLEK